MTIGWKLDTAQRSTLLERFEPRWPNVVADHITLDAQAADRDKLPNDRGASITGYASDGEGVEALVVAIGGDVRRPDGGTYHLTWSLDKGREASESNDVIASHGWRKLDQPVMIRIVPAKL